MANVKSAIKRARQSLKRKARNQMVKSATHTSVVNAIEMIEKATTLEQARIGLQKAERALKKAASKGIYPVERANRKTSRIAARVSKKFSKPQVTSTQK